MLREFGVNLVQGYLLDMPGENLPRHNLQPHS
jgi:EAL domain-containing protein (putative c-di-GMP-specific phosphodiesterase class I)